MEVFVVTDGVYSDYHICGIFSTREKAEEFLAELPKDYQYRPSIEEWELDSTETQFKQIFSEILNEDGSRWIGSTPDHTGATHFATYDEIHKGWRGEWGFWYSYDQGVKSVNQVWAKSAVSQEHATKLAAEGRQAHLRGEISDYSARYTEGD